MSSTKCNFYNSAGTQGKLYPAIKQAAEAKGLTLLEGKGNDKDTLGKKVVWVMDTTNYPFYQAEIYHQFHGEKRVCASRMRNFEPLG